MTDIWLFLALAYVAAYIAGLVLEAFWPIRMTGRHKAAAMLLALSIAVIAFRLKPGPGLDLYRLHQNVDAMRAAGGGLIHRMGAVQSRYSGMLAFNLLCAMVSFFENNGWLSAVAVFGTFSMLLWVLLDFLKKEEYGSDALLPAVAIVFMGVQVQYAFSGVRNALAVAMTALGIYWLLYRRQRRAGAIVLLALAMTMHPIVLAVIPTAILSGTKKQKVWRLAVLFALPIVFWLADKVLAVLPIAAMRSLGERILFYTDRAYAYDRPEMIANFAMFAAIGGGYWLLERLGCLEAEQTGWKRYVDAYYLMGFAMIGCVFRRDFALRMGYLMGIAAVPLLCRILFRRVEGANEKLAGIVPILVRLGLAVCCAKVYYDTLVVMMQWQFV